MSSKAKLESVLGKFTSVQLISSRLRRNTGLKEAGKHNGLSYECHIALGVAGGIQVNSKKESCIFVSY